MRPINSSILARVAALGYEEGGVDRATGCVGVCRGAGAGVAARGAGVETAGGGGGGGATATCFFAQAAPKTQSAPAANIFMYRRFCILI